MTDPIIPEAHRALRPFAFGDGPELADELLELVLKGVKTATCRRYGEVDAAFAHDEGEGDRSLAYRRDAHREYFGRQGKFSEDMMQMCERFRLVEIFQRTEQAL